MEKEDILMEYNCLIYQKKLSYQFKSSIKDLNDLKLKIIKELELNISPSLLFLYDNQEDCDLENEESFDIKKKHDKIYIKVLPCENIFKSLLPPLGSPLTPLSRPSISFKHLPATLEVHTFKCLRDQKTKTIYSNIWSLLSLSREKNLSFSNEYEVGNYVISVIQDIIYSDKNIRAKCIREIEVSGLEPNIWISSNTSNLPIGVVQFKKPFDLIIDHHRVHGEVYDFMVNLKEMYGILNVFGIVSTYKKWRVYWLPEADSVASSEYISKKTESKTEIQQPNEIPTQIVKSFDEEIFMKKPYQQKQFQKQDLFNQQQYQQQQYQQNQYEQQFQFKQIPQQQFQQQLMKDQQDTNQQKRNYQSQFQNQQNQKQFQLQNTPKPKSRVENNKFKPSSSMNRIVYGTESYDYSSNLLPITLLSVINKMYYGERKSKVQLLDTNRKYIQLVKETWYWVDIDIDSLKYTVDIDFDNISAVIILLDLGGGAHGRAWFCCTIEGYVFVLKFSEETFTDLENESNNWKKFWNFNSKVETWNDRPALMIPYLSPATENDWKDYDFILKVSHTITRLAANGLYHQDLRKRHVGKYLDKYKKVKIAFFDLSLCEDNRQDLKEIEELMKSSLFDNDEYHILNIN